jgi:hypothetical protein
MTIGQKAVVLNVVKRKSLLELNLEHSAVIKSLY